MAAADETDWATREFAKTKFEDFAEAQLTDFPEAIREQVRASLIAVMSLAYRRGRHEARAHQRRVITLCGSTRFKRAFREFEARFELEGHVVMSVVLWGETARVDPTPDDKATMDAVHRAKIDMSDEIFVLDVGRYVGDSTRGEIEYAEQHGKVVQYLSKAFPSWSDTEAQYRYAR